MAGQTLDKTTTPTPTDGQLLEGIAKGDESSLASLYDRYHSLAFGLALRVLNDRGRAEDVVQDAFLSVWRKAGSYAETRGSVKTWLATIVRNRAIDVVRGRRESDGDDEAVLLALEDSRPSILEQVTASLDAGVVRQIVAGLPPEQRHAIALAYFEGLSHSEIAAATQLPLGTVKSRIRLGMQRLKAQLLEVGMQPDREATPAIAGIGAMIRSAPPSAVL
jgi:RNA polymerase sigma-70 factor (ECF subfamily)